MIARTSLFRLPRAGVGLGVAVIATVLLGNAFAAAGVAAAADTPDAVGPFISNPSLALVLTMIGVYGLISEFAAPGTGIAGLAGAVCLLIGIYALQRLGVDYAGLGLLLFGVVLWIGELLLPSFGVLAIGGAIAFVAGGMLLFNRPGVGVPLTVIAALAASSVAVVLLTVGLALRARKRVVVSGREQLLRATGAVTEVEDGEAWAQVMGERWRVRSDQELAPGQPVRVVGIDGLTLDVRRDPDQPFEGQAT